MQRRFKPSALIIILFCQKGNKEGKVLSQHLRISFWLCEHFRPDLKEKCWVEICRQFRWWKVLLWKGLMCHCGNPLQQNPLVYTRVWLEWQAWWNKDAFRLKLKTRTFYLSTPPPPKGKQVVSWAADGKIFGILNYKTLFRFRLFVLLMLRVQ